MTYPITFRSVKGSPLTHDEMDDNLREATQVCAKWSSTRQYVLNELVAYTGIIYKANVTNTNKQPDINGVEWSVYIPTHTHVFADISTAVKDEDDMASNSAVHVPTQQSVKAYVDSQLGFTAEDAQDAVGAIVTDTTSIDLAYNDGANQITATIKSDGIVEAMLAATNSPTIGYALTSDGGTGFTWAAAGGSMDFIVEATGSPSGPPTASGTGSIAALESAAAQGENSIAFGLAATTGTGADNSAVIGGEACNIGDTTHSFIGSGYLTTIDHGHHFSAALAGESNQMTGSDATHALLLGGKTNAISGTSNKSTIIGGENNTITGATFALLTGYNSTLSADYTFAHGHSANAYRYGMSAFASGNFSGAGDAQGSRMVVRNATSNNTTTTLYLDGTSAEMTMPSTGTWAFIIKISARQTGGASGTVGDSAVFIKHGGVKIVGGSVSILGTPTETSGSDVAASAWTAALSTSGSNFQIRVTGETNKNIRWVATVELSEVRS